MTNTGSFGVLTQNSEIVASPTNFNTNQTSALETDENGDIQFVDSNFTSSKFLIDGEFELDNEGNFQQKIKLEDYFGSSWFDTLVLPFFNIYRYEDGKLL